MRGSENQRLAFRRPERMSHALWPVDEADCSPALNEPYGVDSIGEISSSPVNDSSN